MVDFRRPSFDEIEQTVIASNNQMLTWQMPKGGGYEMLSPDDLLTRRGFKVYREMRADDQVKACLWFKKMLIAGRTWEIVECDKRKAGAKQETSKDSKKPGKFGGFGSGPDQSTPVPPPMGAKPVPPKPKDPNAEWIEEQLGKLPMKQYIWEMLTAIDFGVSFGELIWEINDDYKFVLKDIAFRDPEYMHIIIDEHGNIQRFEQWPNMGPKMEHINIKPEKMLHFAYQSEFRNHWGQSDLRAAYRAWWSKKYVTQFFNVFLERFGAPLMMMKYPPGASSELKSALKSILSSLSSKTDILVPEGVTVELIEATRAGTAKFDEAIKLYDTGIAKAILMPALLGASDVATRGSDSQSRLHLKTLMKMTQFLCEQIEAEITKKIVQPMNEKNFNEETEYKFQFQDYGEFESYEITDAIKELHNAGILTLDNVDTNFVRSLLGLRLRSADDADQVERPMLNQLPGMGGGNAQAEGGGAKSGNDRAGKGASTKVADSKGKVKAEADEGDIVHIESKDEGNNNSPVNVTIEPATTNIVMPEVKVDMPENMRPTVNLTVPEQAAPVIHVNVPEQHAPQVNVTMPEQKKRKFKLTTDKSGNKFIEEV